MDAILDAGPRSGAMGRLAPVGLGVVNAGGVLVDANDALAELLGCASLGELLATPLARFHALPELALELLRDHLDGDRIRGMALELRRLDGTALLATVRARIDHDGGDGARVYFSVEDVGPLTGRHEESSQLQKMEAVSRLAAGLAHDYNNLLTTVLGEARQIVREADGNEPVTAAASAIVGAARRGADLTRRLLVFSRSDVARPKILDLNQALRSLAPLVERRVSDDVELVWRLEDGIPEIRIDPSHLETIVGCLTSNAHEAMPAGGRIVLESGTLAAPDDTEGLDLHPVAPPGTYAYLAVGDSGIGMNQETRRRIFDPFFTTKEHGRGVGLSTVFGLVRRAEGYVSVLSAPAYGTVVRVLLPTTDEAPLPMRPPRRDGPVRIPTTARVLVVDDEPSIRQMLCKVLGRAGYAVLEAAGASAARRVLESAPVDLLITDVMMPDTPGTVLAGWATRRDPRLRLLLVSGYSETALIEPFTDVDPDVFLPKPFEPDELLERVRGRLADA